MKSILTLIPLIFSLLSFSQNDEVKTYYQCHNQILENFARTRDTAKYLDEMYVFITLNGKKYVRLTHHNSFLDLCLAQKDYKLAELIVEKQLKYNLGSHVNLNDTSFTNNTKNASFYNRPEILQLIESSDEQYKELMSKVNLFKSIRLNSLIEIDQFGRTIIELESIDTVRFIYNAIISYTDSTNLVKLYNYIEEYGFPEQNEVGYFADFIILWHTYYRPCGHTYTLPNGHWYYDYLDSVYFQAVLDGNCRNLDYAYMKDDSFTDTYGSETFPDCKWKGQKYVTWYQGKLSGDLFDAKNIDKYRTEIYLPPYWVDAVLNGWEIPADYPIPENITLKY